VGCRVDNACEWNWRTIVTVEPEPSTTRRAPTETGSVGARDIAEPNDVRIHGHCAIIYWWIVWVYGVFCAVVSIGWGNRFAFDGGTGWHVYPGTWLGTSFVFLVLFVIIFSNIRIWTPLAIAFLASAGLIVESLQRYLDISIVRHARIPVVIYMNAAFYAVFSLILLSVWLFFTLVADRWVYWVIGRSRAQCVHVMQHRDDMNFASTLLIVKRQRPDLFRYILGLGASDIVIQPEGEKGQSFVVENVLRAKAKWLKIQKVT
jgi:hypothetical protein